MVKKCARNDRRGLTLAGAMIPLLLSCAGAPPATSRQQAAVAATLPSAGEAMLANPQTLARDAFKKLWTQRAVGLVTDMVVSRDGSATLIATIPNPDAVAGPREPGRGLTRYDRNGKKLWRIDLKGTVKSMAVTDDGKLALVSTYDNELLAIDPRGKTVWKLEGICKPVMMGKRFVCYHDDDADPKIGFDVFSLQGKRQLQFPIPSDIVALKVSEDERNLAIALEGGQVILFDPEFRSIWQRRVSGEVVDLAISSGKDPIVAALFNPKTPSQEIQQGIAVYDESGSPLGDARLVSRVEQIELAPGGQALAAYGNGALGQFVALFEVPAKVSPQPVILKEKWRRGDPRSSDFSSSVVATRDRVILGFEENTPRTRRSHLVAYDFEGKLQWDIPLVADEGSYLYLHGFASKASVVAVGTDDGTLSAYKIK